MNVLLLPLNSRSTLANFSHSNLALTLCTVENMLTAYYFLLTALPLGTHGIRTRQADSTFQLYAYGNELGGLPVFYADGNQIN